MIILTAYLKPSGPFRIIEGEEYRSSRSIANKANDKIRRTKGLRGVSVDIHEVHPIKFGGSPSDQKNKVVLDRAFHRKNVTPWWNKVMQREGKEL